MEFYREGKVLGLTANTRLDLGSSALKHKAAMILCDVDCKLEFYSQNAVSLGVTYSTDATYSSAPPTSAFTNGIIPVRLAGVTPATGASATSKIILFN
jgi:hypothetical protein